MEIQGWSSEPLVCIPSEEMLDELKEAFLGFFRSHGDGVSLQHELILEGLGKIKVIPMGGNMMLLQ